MRLGCCRRGSVWAGGGPPELDAAASGGRDRKALRRAHLLLTAVRGATPKGAFRWRGPRHTLKGRQDGDAVDRAGLRRKLLKAQAEAGDIVLLFGDASEALTHPDLAHVWAKKGADVRIPAPGQAAKVAMLGLLDWRRRELIVRTSRTQRRSDFIALLEEIDRRYGPVPGVAIKPVRLVLDNGPIHTSKLTRAALERRGHPPKVEGAPSHTPQLNEIEELWRDLKCHTLPTRLSREWKTWIRPSTRPSWSSIANEIGIRCLITEALLRRCGRRSGVPAPACD